MLPLNQMILLCLFLLGSRLVRAEDEEVKNRTEVAAPADESLAFDEAEFRQGSIGQQLMAGYPVAYGAGASGGAGAGAGYVNMLRNLYRPPSLGLTDKVKHWVKSFMNRRQYVKPYYNPSGLQYQPEEFGAGKPYIPGYKAISVPLRQLQKYYKPYYGSEQYMQQQQNPSQQAAAAAAASSALLSYNSPGSMYSGGDYFGASSAGGFSAGDIFSAQAGGYPDSAQASALFSAYGTGGGSPVGGQAGLYQAASGASGSLYPGSSGSSGASFYQQQSGSPSGGYSLDSSSLYGQDAAGGSAASFYGSSAGGGSRGAAPSSGGYLPSSGGGASSYGGDLFASGASPAATVYNPNSQGDQQSRGHKKPTSQQSSALYMSSSDTRMAEQSYAESAKEQPSNSFNVDSSRGSSSQQDSGSPHSYSLSFQGSSGFQPVSFASDFQGKSS